MKNTSNKGNLTQGMVLAALLQAGKKVLTPFGDGGDYDLLIENHDGESFSKVQCKTGILKNGAVKFNNYTVLRDGSSRKYGDKVDVYGVYCPQNGKVYLVPAAHCASSSTHLRVSPAKNNQAGKTRTAEKYEIATVTQR